jgi:hypothetical protein
LKKFGIRGGGTKGRHRIRHYGLFANGKHRAANIARARQLLAVPQSAAAAQGGHRPSSIAAACTPYPSTGSKTSIADEMREEHARRVLGD